MLESEEGFLKKDIVIGIIGLGYVGLPLAIALVRVGYTVIGIDYDINYIEQLNQGISRVKDVSNDMLQEVLKTKRVKITNQYTSVACAQAILICVPTPLNSNKEPELRYIVEAMDGIIENIVPQTLVILESTTYPGTTEKLIIQRIEAEKNWVVGKEFFVCYSPERVDPGNPIFKVENTPKVVGGATSTCLRLGKSLYESFLPHVTCLSTTKVAEMSKLLENTFRCINIAMINEMAMMCERMEIDIWEVIKGASTKPFGFMPFYPGPGVGGHCIPLDPMYLSWEGKKYNYFNRFIELSMDINTNMPYYVIGQIKDILEKNNKLLSKSKILLLGVSYKKDINDVRESPALEIYSLLTNQGANVKIYDPYVGHFKRRDKQIEGLKELTQKELEEADLVVITTAHSQVNYKLVVEVAPIIYDTCNVLESFNSSNSNKIIKLGNKVK